LLATKFLKVLQLIVKNSEQISIDIYNFQKFYINRKYGMKFFGKIIPSLSQNVFLRHLEKQIIHKNYIKITLKEINQIMPLKVYSWN